MLERHRYYIRTGTRLEQTTPGYEPNNVFIDHLIFELTYWSFKWRPIYILSTLLHPSSAACSPISLLPIEINDESLDNNSTHRNHLISSPAHLHYYLPSAYSPQS